MNVLEETGSVAINSYGLAPTKNPNGSSSVVVLRYMFRTPCGRFRRTTEEAPKVEALTVGSEAGLSTPIASMPENR